MLGFDLYSYVQNFKKIASELTEKSTKNMRYRFTKKKVSQDIVDVQHMNESRVCSNRKPSKLPHDH